MDRSLRDNRSIVLPACAGLASALFTIGAEQAVTAAVPSQLGQSLIQQLYVGVVFGVFVAAGLVAHDGLRSIAKGIAFVAASAAAYLAAVSAAFGADFLFPPNASMNSGDLVVPLPIFFVAGCTGAFLILAAALVLFGEVNFSRRTVRKILLGAAAGGVLGVAGWACGPLVGRPVLLAAFALHLRPSWATFHNDVTQNVPRYFSLYLIWQTGMAAVLALVTSREAIIEPAGALSPALSEARVGRRPPRPAAVVAGLFLAVLFGYLGLEVSRTVRSQRAVAVRMEAYKTAQAETPSLQNLPPMAPRGWEETFVLEDIGGLVVEKPSAQNNLAQPGDLQRGFPGIPPSTTYSVNYVPRKDAPLGLYQPMVRVFVEQYPDVEWARYRTRYPTMFNPALDDPKVLTTVTKFGQRIVMNTQMRSANGDGALYFVWPSGNLVILISYEIREVNEDFIRRYLEKHPSSL